MVVGCLTDALAPPPTPINLAKRCSPVSSTREVRREEETVKVILGYRATRLFMASMDYRTVSKRKATLTKAVLLILQDCSL